MAKHQYIVRGTQDDRNEEFAGSVLDVLAPSIMSMGSFVLKVTYTDAPPAGHNSVELNVPRYMPGQAPERPAQKGIQRELVVYGTTTCPYCKGLRADLDRRGISYRFIEVDRNAEGRAKMKAMGADGVPFTTAGGKTYSGYSPGGLESFLKGLGGL